jgi:hypothetical protein
MPSVSEILKTEFSEQFVQYMKNRMATSYFKYGNVKDAQTIPKINNRENIQKRLNLYYETGNTEWLVDAANLIMMEFMYPQIAGAVFRATDSHESPGMIPAEPKIPNG